MKKAFKIIGLVLVVVITAPVLLGLLLKGLATDVPAPGKMVDVGGFDMHLYCTGPQNHLPTLVIESGIGGMSANYYFLQESL